MVASPSQLDELLADADPDTVWLVGGEMIYRLLLPLSMIYVNRIRPRFTFLK